MTNVTQLFPPFSKEFHCLECDSLDTGSFCSSCGKELEIKKCNVGKALAGRLMRLGFTSFKAWAAKYAVVFNNFHFSLWEGVPVEVLIKTNEGRNGLRLQLVVIGSVEDIEFDKVAEMVTTQMIQIQNSIINTNKLPRKKRPKEICQYLENLSFKVINIHDGAENFPSFNQNKFKLVVKTRKPIIRLFNQSGQDDKFVLRIYTNIVSLCRINDVIYSKKNAIYDVVNHQVMMVMSQTDIEKYSLIEVKSNLLFTILGTLTSEVLDFFKTLFQYVKNPHLFSELIAEKNVIKPSKIINLYLVGLVCSVSLSSLFSGGQLNEENLTKFGILNLPPIFSDIFEVLTEFLFLSITAFAIHTMAKIKGKTGSFGSMLLGLIFIDAFLQLFFRPYGFMTDLPLLKLLNGDTKWYKRIVYDWMPIITIPIEAYFLFPMTQAIYGLNRRSTVLAYIVPTLLAFLIGSYIVKDSLISDNFITKRRIYDMFQQEEKIMSDYDEKIISLINNGDVISAKKEGRLFIQQLEQISEDCSNIVSNLDTLDVLLVEFGNAECAYTGNLLIGLNLMDSLLNQGNELVDFSAWKSWQIEVQKERNNVRSMFLQTSAVEERVVDTLPISK